MMSYTQPNITSQGCSQGGPGVPVTPLLQAFLIKQPTTGGENAMTIPWP